MLSLCKKSNTLSGPRKGIKAKYNVLLKGKLVVSKVKKSHQAILKRVNVSLTKNQERNWENLNSQKIWMIQESQANQTSKKQNQSKNLDMI